MRIHLVLSSLFVALVGCTLPFGDATEPTDSIEEDDRVFSTGPRDGDSDVVSSTAPPGFAFVIDVGGPEVVLAQLLDDSIATGVPEWATPAWLTPELAVRRDVDVHAVPLELLVRQGEPFVTTNEDGDHCVGYLGELSVIRMIADYNVGDLGREMTEEEQNEALDTTRIGPPTSERLLEPGFIWDTAQYRTYLVAALEGLDDCVPGRFGAHSDHVPETFVRTATRDYDDEARRMLRTHPDYAEQQAAYDAWRLGDSYPGASDDWPAGPWDAQILSVSVFEASDGGRIVLAQASDETFCGGSAPGALFVVYDVQPDGTLTYRQDLEQAPPLPLDAILEQDGALILVDSAHAVTATDTSVVADIAPLQLGCGC